MNCRPVLVVLLLTLTVQIGDCSEVLDVLKYLSTNLLLILTGQKNEIAGDCSVYDTPQSSSTDRCRQVQECVEEAFFMNGNNRYYLDRVFRSTQSPTPVALIVNYHVIIPQNGKANDSDFGVSANGSDSGSGSGFGSTDESNGITVEAEMDTSSFTNYTEEIGWSTTGIYKAIRPEVLVALQPAWYWLTIGFAIDNFSFPRSLHLALNVTSSNKCSELANITRPEVREALEYLTMNLTGNTAYIWNIDINLLQPKENVLFVAIVIQGIFLFVLLTALLPRAYHAYSENNKSTWDSNSLEFLLIMILFIEIFCHILFRLHFSELDLYSSIRNKLEYVVPSAGVIGAFYGTLIGCSYQKCSCRGIRQTADNFCSIYMLVICFAAYSLPVLIEAFIYPTEIVSTIGFIMIVIATISAGHTILNRYTRSDSKIESTSKLTKYWYYLHMGLGCAFLYFINPAAVYVLLIFYLSLLKLLLKSPTSQLFQLIVTLVPVIVGICSFLIQKKLGNEKKANQPKESTDSEFSGDNSDDDETKHVRQKRKHKRDYRRLVNEEDDQPQNSTSTREQNQPERRQPRRRVRVATQLHDRQQTPQESSREAQVAIEMDNR